MTFDTNSTREKMLDNDANLDKIVGGITFDSSSAIVSILELGRGSWKDSSFSDSNVKGNSCQGSFPSFIDGSPVMYGSGGSGGASDEFDEITSDYNLLGWKAFNQLSPSKKSWIVSTLVSFQGNAEEDAEEEMLKAMQKNSPLPDEDVKVIVEFIFTVVYAYEKLLEHISYVDSSVWEVKSKSSKKSSSKSNEDKEKEFKEAFSSLGLLE
jgi:hypothetical protein